MDNSMLILLFIIVGFFMFMNYSRTESLDNVDYASYEAVTSAIPDTTTPAPTVTIKPTEKMAFAANAELKDANTINNSYVEVSHPQTDMADKIVNGSKQLTAHDLLPKYDEASDFVKENPVSDLLKEQNFLISGYHMGVNTVMQSNKIPYHDLRSAPAIPKQNLGPFLNSSYETFGGSTGRRYFEVGSA